MNVKNYIKKVKQLSGEEHLSNAVIYRELEDLQEKYKITDEKIFFGNFGL